RGTDGFHAPGRGRRSTRADGRCTPGCRKGTHMTTDDLNRHGLSIGERRFVGLVCVAAAVDVPAIDAHVYAALASGELTIEQLNEFTLHFAVHCGWPRGSQLEMSVRTQWQRIHDERGEPAPAFPQLGVEDLGIADPAL